MTKPNEVYPGWSYGSSRRVKDGAFRLTARAELVQIVKYLSVYHAVRHRLPLLMLVVMSNHIHHVFDDPLGVFPDFLRDLHGSLAKAINQLHFGTEKGQFWDHEKPSVQRLLSPQATIDRLLYTAVNPVEAGIEPHAFAWPGYLFGPERAGMVVRVERPAVLSSNFPEVMEYRVPVPQDYGNQTPKQVRAHFRRELRKREKLERKKRGDKPFIGTAAALQLTHVEVPAYPLPEHADELKPAYAGSRPLVAKAAGRRREFRKRYRECRRRQKAGETNIVWPPGTFQQVFRFGGDREPSPERSFHDELRRGPPPAA